MASRVFTIGDVAARAGVSRSTVSRVLSGVGTSIPISEGTRQRVLAVAHELGYRPHPGARSLTGKSTHLLGVIVREINDPFFAELIDSISSTAKDRGYDLVLGNAKRDPERALALRDQMLDMRYCDGILLCGDLAESTEDNSFLARLDSGHRLVSVCRGNQQPACNVPSVGVDNLQGSLLALEHLAGLGHGSIACFDAGRVGDLAERLQVYREYMHAHFGGAPGGYVVSAENSFDGGYGAARRLLSQLTPPTAIFAVDDTMAVGALAAAADLGLSVPRYVSIVGFDDSPMSSYVRPALTTVRQPIRVIGERAVIRLLDLIEHGQAEDCPHVAIEPLMVVRDSTARPREAARGAGDSAHAAKAIANGDVVRQ